MLILQYITYEGAYATRNDLFLENPLEHVKNNMDIFINYKTYEVSILRCMNSNNYTFSNYIQNINYKTIDPFLVNICYKEDEELTKEVRDLIKMYKEIM